MPLSPPPALLLPIPHANSRPPLISHPTAGLPDTLRAVSGDIDTAYRTIVQSYNRTERGHQVVRRIDRQAWHWRWLRGVQASCVEHPGFDQQRHDLRE